MADKCRFLLENTIIHAKQKKNIQWNRKGDSGENVIALWKEKWNAGSGNRGDRRTPYSEQSCRVMRKSLCFTKVHTGWKVEFKFASITSWLIFKFYGKQRYRTSKKWNNLVKNNCNLLFHSWLNSRFKCYYIKLFLMCLNSSTQSFLL